MAEQQHNVKIKRDRGRGTSQFNSGSIITYDAWAVCSCGWTSHDGYSLVKHRTRTEAQAKALAVEHVAAAKYPKVFAV